MCVEIARENSSMVDFYVMELPSDQSFSELFESKKINLIDMPGLGGPYFKDTEKTLKYIENLDMLLVVIKITEIELASQYIEPYISKLRIPIIPVLTFFDCWKNSGVFQKCSNEEEATNTAIELVIEKIPSLTNYRSRIIAVSSLKNFQVDTLQSLILNFVEEQNFAIDKIQKEGTEIYHRKIEEILRELNSFTSLTKNSLEKLKREVSELIPPNSKFEQFGKKIKYKIDRFLKDNTRNNRREIRNIYNEFKNKVNDIRDLPDYKSIENHLKKLETEINTNHMQELQAELKQNMADAKIMLSSETDKYIDNMNINLSDKQELKDEISDYLENYEINLDELNYERPEISSDKFKDYGKTVIDLILGNMSNPQFLISLLIGTAMCLLGKFVPYIGNFVLVGGVCLLVATILFAFFMDASAKKHRFLEAKNSIIDKVIPSLDKSTFEKKANLTFTNAIKEVTNEIDDKLNEIVNPYSHDLKS